MTDAIGRKKYDLDRTVRLVLTCASVGLGVFLINYLSSILLPFVVGCLLAYMLEPVVRFFMRVFHLKNRMFPALLTMTLFFGALFLACWFLIPSVIESFVDMGKLLGKYITHEMKSSTMPDWLLQFVNEYLSADKLEAMFSKDQIFDFFKSVMSGTVSVLGTTIHFVLAVVSWLVALLYMFFVLLDYDIIARGFKASVPKPYRHTVFRIFNDVTGHATLFPWPGVGVAVRGHYFRHRVLDYQTADGYCVWSFNWRDEYGAIPPTRFHSVCGFPLRGAVCGYWRAALAAVWLDFCRLLHLPSHSGFGADSSDYAFANRTSPGYRILGVGALGLCVGLYRTDYRFASHFAAHFVLQRVYPPCA